MKKLTLVDEANLMLLADHRIISRPENKGIVDEALKSTGIDVPAEPSDTFNSRLVEAARVALKKGGSGCKIPNPAGTA